MSAWLRLPSRLRDPRHDIERDLAILNDLPEQSGARGELLSSIDERLISLVTQAGDERRNPLGVVLGVALCGASGYGAWWFGRWGGWWWFVAVILASFALIMLSVIRQDWQKAPRTKTGTRLDVDRSRDLSVVSPNAHVVEPEDHP